MLAHPSRVICQSGTADSSWLAALACRNDKGSEGWLFLAVRGTVGRAAGAGTQRVRRVASQRLSMGV